MNSFVIPPRPWILRSTEDDDCSTVSKVKTVSTTSSLEKGSYRRSTSESGYSDAISSPPPLMDQIQNRLEYLSSPMYKDDNMPYAAGGGDLVGEYSKLYNYQSSILGNSTDDPYRLPSGDVMNSHFLNDKLPSKGVDFAQSIHKGK